MTQQELLRDEPINFEQVRRFLKSAAVKLERAAAVIPIDEQTGFQMAYEAMLRASLGFMLSMGKRPRSTAGHHRVIIDFVAGELGSSYVAFMTTFDRMRRKRNEAIYEPLGTITETEARAALDVALRYLHTIHEHIQRRNPQQKLL
ncbi:hypothetical protein HY624_03590 [Candidatus Uhrbacteria bacterium]|nr:hypothetical protein [Candidatus Uhrbacteria bacterium]